MLTPEQRAEINRENAQKSTGPRTEAGREKTRFNACRHNLTGHTFVMDDDDRQAWNEFVGPYIASLAPQGPVETQLAQLIAQDNWRLNRIPAIEESTLLLGHERSSTCVEGTGDERVDNALTHAKTFINRDNRALANLSLHESRICRNLERNRKQLEALQAKRAEEEAKVMEEAELLAELAASENREFNPEEFGFVFSTTQIQTRIHKKQQLERAHRLRERRTAIAA